MSHHIPSDIVIEILACLPVKSLLRFTAVCKQWHSIIKNPNFITKHLNQFGKLSPDQLLFMTWDKQDFLQVLPNYEKLDKNYIQLDLPFNGLKRGSHRIRMLGSCNGLICLYIIDTHLEDPTNIIIWNPCIRKSVTLPPPKNLPSRCCDVIGFGFDLVKNMFKVVRIIYSVDIEKSQVEVFDQGEREWRLIGRAPPHYISSWSIYSSQVFFHGAVHWLTETIDTHVKSIVAFDIGDEMFREIALPGRLPRARLCTISMSSFKNSLMLLSGWRERGSLVDNTEFNVWTMRDYGVFESWTHLYNFILPTVMKRPLGFIKDGKVLFASKNDMHGIISFDPDTRTITKTSIKGMVVASSTVLKFVESLVLLT